MVAKAAGCSRALAHRLLRRGLSKAEICARIAENKRRKAELLDLPTTSVRVDGHAANDGLMSFSEAQCKKEITLSKLRELEYQQKVGMLIPVAYVKTWLADF